MVKLVSNIKISDTIKIIIFFSNFCKKSKLFKELKKNKLI